MTNMWKYIKEFEQTQSTNSNLRRLYEYLDFWG